MEYISPFTERINTVAGVITALLTYVLGEYWALFFFFLFLNVLDVITGCMKAWKKKKSNSHTGAEGVMKKLAYWIMIMVAFGMAACFQEIGQVIGLNLGITSLIGWFVLCSLIINELRSVLENLVEYRVQVPYALIKGLEVADKMLDDTFKMTNDHPDDIGEGGEKEPADRSEERKEE